ncbi:uncharacterized protein LOC130190559 isoform X3 [Pseudoliparis swirei]|nr:uncharacterized protein LOC130190559 isoform X3 [Pseudoliparis swirei]XP_056266005.1 uncharacterized protein LOC130190559 isoform X3 [Pseudoliparis swirei]XP_056266006.1 uncharacterized protein LOC130190559 isoform X3 [Pseudoliparis swirei]
MDVEEPDLGFEEPEGMINRERNTSGCSEAESSGLPAYPVCVPQCQWEEGGGEQIRFNDIQDQLLGSCCTAEGSIESTSPSSMLEYWVYCDNQHDMADCPVASIILTPPATPAAHSLFAPSSVTAAVSAVSSVVKSMVCSPVTDRCGPISPTRSAWDALGSTSRSPGSSDRDPVSAAAHLHLLGESLSLIGHHLQETSKVVSVSSSASLLLDSLLCALAPLIGLTAQIPELRSCTQHTLPSTLENISFLMPGL